MTPALLLLLLNRYQSFTIYSIMLRNYRIYLLGAFALLASSCHSSTTPPPVAAPPSFAATPLTANKAIYGVAASNIDTNMQDTWGLAFDTVYGDAWVANRASGTTSDLAISGAPKSAFWDINGVGGSKGRPTGIIQNTSHSFVVPTAGLSADWIFSELNGTIAAVVEHARGDSSFNMLDRSNSSGFTGLALVTSGGVTRLIAPDPRSGFLDQFDASFGLLPNIPSRYYNQSYVPFNAVVIDTQIFVTYGKQSPTPPYVVVGPGNGGFVDTYGLNGTFDKALITNDSLDEPWGVTIAPPSFGSYSGDLLVGNFGDGTIHAYNRSTGALIGTLNDASGAPIVINGLWALVVYNGTLYYTAGPNGGADGVFGTITVK